jgi:phosphatidylinositol alpha-1,6-mannosyltransferase
MKKILIITRNFPPVLGGMERLNGQLVEELAKYHAIAVVAPGGARAQVSAGIAVHEVALTPLWRCLVGMAWRGLRCAWKWRPDVILGGSGLVAPIVWCLARVFGARAFVYVHGLDLTVPHPVYQALWLPFVRRMDGVISNSGVTRQIAIDLGARSEQVFVVNPGVAEVLLGETGRGQGFCERYGLEDKKVLLSVGRLAARKGLREFVQDALPLIVARQPDVVFVIIGTEPKNALFAEAQSPESIQAAADAAGVGAHIRLLGSVTDEVLQEAFFAADLHVFPVRHIPSNPEGFGMVAIEAAMHGVATAAYATGGVVEAVRDGENGLLVEPANAQALADAIATLLDSPLPKARVHAFAMQFSWENFGSKISALL